MILLFLLIHVHQFCILVTSHTNPRAVHVDGRIMRQRATKSHTSIKELIIDDAIISDEQTIAESFNNFFVNIGTKLASEIDDSPDEESTNNLSLTLESILKFT